MTNLDESKLHLNPIMKVHVNKFNHRSLNNLSICSTGLQILYTRYIDASHPFGMLRKPKY